jgi:glutamyl-tRNA synthetase
VRIARELGLPAPRYAHVPLVLSPDGQRLAKRHGAVTLADRLAAGESPAEVLAFLAAGLRLADAGEPVTPENLLARFDPAGLPTEPTRLDAEWLAGAPRARVRAAEHHPPIHQSARADQFR